ncbi:ClpP/crotonase-like domain-containing protein [Jimgerdemannia flammicorona]|uniref:Uncharacterized protein n=2 Tax=Jimgerdemannia flammicorona TaxID=994334 RepID=A0A433QJD3_9FUNG|nr:ClpP/crotonase-like domain-containing protein [Jimgerdemannia flammicorona]RUS29885.1 hypothetical protein BC938DRAFT_480105 [Jimgerdemannia flammicorona]
MSPQQTTPYTYETVNAAFVSDGLLHVELNRPKKLNTFNQQLWADVRKVFEQIKADSDVRAVVVSGAGRLFTAGLDLSDNVVNDVDRNKDPARVAFFLRPHIMVCSNHPLAGLTFRLGLPILHGPIHKPQLRQALQDTFTAIEKCDKPVIVVVHNGCIGAGVDLITACDIRLATKDAYFSVKEVDVGLAADVGTLQRLPKVMGNQSLVRELCLTGRNLPAAEALQHGLVSRVFEDKDKALAEALKLGGDIVQKSPVAVVGTKHIDPMYAQTQAYLMLTISPHARPQASPQLLPRSFCIRGASIHRRLECRHAEYRGCCQMRRGLCDEEEASLREALGE